MFKFISLVLRAVLSGHSAMAFHLGDHERITVQAYNEFVRCFSGVPLDKDILVDGNLNEDTDIVTKGLIYSHFYSPKKKLDMWREDSSGRILNLEPSLAQCRNNSAKWTEYEVFDLGHVIHHFQDMAVPSHVVPVGHSFFDGFESFKIRGDISSGWSCAEIAASRDSELEKILDDTARATLKSVAGFRVEAVDANAHTTRHFRGFDFWQESHDNGFGDYGPLGNNFGNTGDIVTDLGIFYISQEAFRAFKQEQMKQAVRASLRGLAWAFLGGHKIEQLSRNDR